MNPIPLSVARRWANAISQELAPLCHRLAIAGSIRRERPLCNDIDIVCIPRLDETRDLLGEVTSRWNRVTEWAQTYVQKRAGQITGPGEHQPRIISQGQKSLIVQLRRCQLDLWFADEDTFATRLLCRTGSKDHNIWLAQRALDRGLHWQPYEGLKRTPPRHFAGEPLPCPTEASIYNHLGLEWIEPQNRELPWLTKHINSGL